MDPVEIANGLILILQGTHNFDHVNRDGLIARYHQVTSSVTLYLGKDPVVIDSGARVFRSEVKKRLEQYINLEHVKFFIATHYHHDHLDNSDLFPNAVRILDYGYVTPDGVMTVYDDPSKIPAPENIEIFATPGHVKNHISAKITINGVRYVCAGDAIRDDILNCRFVPDYVDGQYIESARRVYAEADIIIPGHGEIITVEHQNLPQLLER